MPTVHPLHFELCIGDCHKLAIWAVTKRHGETQYEMQCYWFLLPEGPATLLKRKLQATHIFFHANVNKGFANIKIQKTRIQSILLHELKSNSLIFLIIFNHFFICSLRLPADPVSPSKIFLKRHDQRIVARSSLHHNSAESL